MSGQSMIVAIAGLQTIPSAESFWVLDLREKPCAKELPPFARRQWGALGANWTGDIVTALAFAKNLIICIDSNSHASRWQEAALAASRVGAENLYMLDVDQYRHMSLAESGWTWRAGIRRKSALTMTNLRSITATETVYEPLDVSPSFRQICSSVGLSEPSVVANCHLDLDNEVFEFSKVFLLAVSEALEQDSVANASGISIKVRGDMSLLSDMDLAHAFRCHLSYSDQALFVFSAEHDHTNKMHPQFIIEVAAP